MAASVSDVESESSEAVSVSSEKPRLVPLGMRTRGGDGGGGRREGGGGTDLSQMLQDLEDCGEGSEDEGRRGEGEQITKCLFPSSTFKKRRLIGLLGSNTNNLLYIQVAVSPLLRS